MRADIVPSRGVQWHATQRLAVALLKEGVENPGERGQIQAGDELTRHCLSNHVAVWTLFVPAHERVTITPVP